MLKSFLVEYSGASPELVERLLLLPSESVYQDRAYQALVQELDRQHLEAMLPHAYAAYENALPDFKARLSSQYDFSDSPMSPATLSTWLVDFLHCDDPPAQLFNYHTRIPAVVLEAGLVDLMAILSTMPEGSAEWQKATAILALPLVAVGQIPRV